MTKTLKFLPIIFGMGMLVFLSGCESEENNPDPQPPTPKPTEEMYSIDDGKVNKEKLEKVIFANGFTSDAYYKKVAELAEETQFNIVNEEIQDTKDVKTCDKLSNKKRNEECKNMFYMTEALSSEKKDVTLCEKISDNNLKTQCKNDVFQSQAQEKNDPAICNKLSRDTLKQDCKNFIYLESAKTQKDSTFCEKIDNEQIKEQCAQEVEFISAQAETLEEAPVDTPPVEETDPKIPAEDNATASPETTTPAQ